MTLHDPRLLYPGVVQPDRYARNGFVVGTIHSQVARYANHIAAYRQKSVFSYARDVGNIAAGASGVTRLWNFMFHAGHAAGKLRIEIGQFPATASHGSDVRCDVQLTPVGGSISTSSPVRYGAVDTTSSSETPGVARFGIIDMDLTPDTTYACTVRARDFARPFFGSAYIVGTVPVDDTASGVVDERISSGMPILDVTQRDIHDALNGLWAKNAAHLWSWTADSEAAAFGTTASAYTNIVDVSTGTPTASTAGLDSDIRYMGRVSQNDVNVKLAVLAEDSAAIGGANNSLRLIDTAGTTHLSVGSFNAKGWYTVTGKIPAAAYKWDMQARADTGSSTVKIYAVSAFVID